MARAAAAAAALDAASNATRGKGAVRRRSELAGRFPILRLPLLEAEDGRDFVDVLDMAEVGLVVAPVGGARLCDRERSESTSVRSIGFPPARGLRCAACSRAD